MGIVVDDQYREQLSERFSEILRIDSRLRFYKYNKDYDLKFQSISEAILVFKNPYFLKTKRR